MNRLSFIKQYILKPKTVGAVLPSSKYLANMMMKNIDFDTARYIVEYGAGTGIFTEKILKARKQNTVVLIFEINIDFYKLLKVKYEKEQNFYIINDSAEYIEKYLLMYDIPFIDYIISGLPFASLPRDVSSGILIKAKKVLNRDGRFITFQYTLFKKDFIGQFFDNINIKIEIRNFPPAYVLCCS